MRLDRTEERNRYGGIYKAAFGKSKLSFLQRVASHVVARFWFSETTGWYSRHAFASSVAPVCEQGNERMRVKKETYQKA